MTAAANDSSRREFLRASSAAAASAGLAATFGAIPTVHAQGSGAINVALIGCGGRGTAAAMNAMQADPDNRLTVMADMFPDQLERSRNSLTKQLGQQMRVTEETAFTGVDAYKRVMES